MRSEEELMPRLLPVGGEDTTGWTLSGAPRNPQEYLRHVQLEASLCPEVVVAHIDPKKLRQKQTVNASVSGCQGAPEGCSPSLAWQRQQVAHFSHIRQSIAKHRRHWSTQTLDENVVMTTVLAVLEILVCWFEEGELVPHLQSPEDERLPALNLLICLVARYFEQNDLADQQE
ncbi:hypothetical protein CRUP_022982 [Coryphaenoides rupestris]|nr:hypothetical protein CRUP_022982 [Coryphaenoides rupestris]